MTALVVLILLSCVQPAQAYVDPGIVGSLYQIVYVLVLGAVITFVVNPFKQAGAFFTRLKNRLLGKSKG